MNPIIIAHRGYSAKHPENTLIAFRAAVEYQCDMIELDIHFSSDNELVVFHDLKLKRITGRKGRICDYSAEELKFLNIPTLKDVLTLINKQVPINIEIKHETIKLPEYRRLMVKKLLQLLNETGMKDAVLISSFDDAFLKELRSSDRTISIGILDHGHRHQKLKLSLAEEIKAYSYHSNQRTLNEKRVQLLHEAGVKVFAYTANDIKQFQKLCSLKVDGIITNEVEQLHRFLHN